MTADPHKPGGDAMGYLFVEMYNYNDTWRNETPLARGEFVARLVDVIAALPEQGIDVLGYAVNDLDTDRRAAYDFFCVYRVASQATQRAFEDNIRAAGWYRYFEQHNLSGIAEPPLKVLADNADLLEPSR
jgi:hypothetical protein